MKPEGWQAQRRIESDYDRAIRRLLHRVWQLVGDETSPFDIVDAILRITRSKLFADFAVAASRKMITQTFTDTAKTWREAAKESSKGRIIYEALQNEMQGSVGATVHSLIERNARIIKSLPLSTAQQVTQYIQEETLKGKRHEQIAREIMEKFPYMSTSRAALIARTEASKAHTALIQARADEVGIAWYEWRTSKDARVRNSHSHMDEVLCRFDSPPSPEALVNERNVGVYNAGEIYNCRCFPRPIVVIDFITWPHKVYYGGKIITMSKEQFRRIM